MTYPAKNEINHLPNLDVFLPLYTTAAIGKLEACHRAVQNGQPLAGAVENKDAGWIRTAFEQSGRAERLLDDWFSMTDEALAEVPFEPLDDFSLATLAQLLFERHVDGGSAMDEKLRERNNQALVACLLSPEWSPLLDYDWMFSDVLGYDLIDNDALYEDLMRRALAHNLRFSNGKDALRIITEMADDHLAAGELDAGLDLYLKLLQAYRSDFYVIEAAALGFSRIRFAKVAWRLAHEARSLSRQLGDFSHEVDDLEMMIPSPGSESPHNWVEDHVLMAIDDVLKRSSITEAGPSPSDFTRQLFPNIGEVPVKRVV